MEKNDNKTDINSLRDEISELKELNNKLRWELLDAQYDANNVSRIHLETCEAAAFCMPIVLKRLNRGKLTYNASTKEARWDKYRLHEEPRIRSGFPQEIKGNKVSMDSIYPAVSSNGEKVAVQLHLYYEDLLDEFMEYFNNIPFPYDLYVSCKDTSDTKGICRRFTELKNVQTIVVRPTENRGRDIASLFALFGREISEYDVFMHVHSKKSLFTGEEQIEWRTSAMKELCGSEFQVRKIFSVLQSDRNVGLYVPETVSTMPLFAHNWLQNKAKGRELSQEFGFEFEDNLFNYSVGSFFWARTSALKPLFDREYKYDDFDEEHGQTDGTLAHALERVMTKVAESRGYILAIGDSDENVIRFKDSYKLYRSYLNQTVQSAEEHLGKFDIVSFDIFDTLITRKLYNPDDLFLLMQKRIKKDFNIDVDFLAIRKKAEAEVWSRIGAKTSIHDIYNELPKVSDIPADAAELLKQLEIQLEYELCIPRKDVKMIFDHLKKSGKKIFLVSDMYLTSEIVEKMLKKCGYTGYDKMILSCEIGLRKDDRSMWDHLAEEWKGLSVVHVGDNLCSDAQLPGDLHLNTFLLLSGRMLFDLSYMAEYMKPFSVDTVGMSYIMGELINHYLFNSPFALDENCKLRAVENTDIAKAVFAPLLLSFVQSIEDAADDDQQLLFLSREGFFLQKLYLKYCEKHGGNNNHNEYFLASRRALSVADIRNEEDIREILSEYYKGTIGNLLDTRLGIVIPKEYSGFLVEMPQQLDMVMKIIDSYIPDYIKDYAEQRKNYLSYADDVIQKNKKPPVVIDLGYSGTIQWRLARLLSEKIDGYYLLTDTHNKPATIGCRCEGLLIKDKDEAGQKLADNTLYLESLLQAPYGQFIRFDRSEDTDEICPVYGKEDDVPPQLFKMQDEILAYTDDLAEFEDHYGENIKINPEVAAKIINAAIETDLLPEDFQRVFSVEDNFYGCGVKHIDPETGKWISEYDI